MYNTNLKCIQAPWTLYVMLLKREYKLIFFRIVFFFFFGMFSWMKCSVCTKNIHWSVCKANGGEFQLKSMRKVSTTQRRKKERLLKRSYKILAMLKKEYKLWILNFSYEFFRSRCVQMPSRKSNKRLKR